MYYLEMFTSLLKLIEDEIFEYVYENDIKNLKIIIQFIINIDDISIFKKIFFDVFKYHDNDYKSSCNKIWNELSYIYTDTPFLNFQIYVKNKCSCVCLCDNYTIY